MPDEPIQTEIRDAKAGKAGTVNIIASPEGRRYFQAFNQGGYDCTLIDLLDIKRWIEKNAVLIARWTDDETTWERIKAFTGGIHSAPDVRWLIDKVASQMDTIEKLQGQVDMWKVRSYSQAAPVDNEIKRCIEEAIFEIAKSIQRRAIRIAQEKIKHPLETPTTAEFELRQLASKLINPKKQETSSWA